ncbi:hypothetical protein M413DRAFT_29217 [Hebeloma cylindrosporum]|uniref:Uncharacterized protein n=1 Tax=Hebeloma cylindrosporum TaxID=76867 RepID=A0A0C2YEM3_HEBCY|nr:hypothetical protein M413DRAFT_29217 [Hebeloma cylindrosporum h7]
MSQSRALLESKRLNTPNANHSQSSSNIQQDRGPPQNTSRVSLSSFLAYPTRISTPTPPRNLHDTAKKQGNENSGSSPLFQPSVSPERAYIQSIRPPSVASGFRMPSLQHSSQTPLRSEIMGTPRPEPTRDDESATHDLTLRYINTTSSRNKELSIRNEQLDQMYKQAANELQECRAQLQLMAAQLHTSSSELNEIRPALAASREEALAKDAEILTIKTVLSETRANLVHTTEENSGLKESHTAERVEIGKLKQTLELSKRRIASLSDGFGRYTSLHESFKELKKSHDSSQSHLAEVMKEAAENRKSAANALTALEPMLDDNNTLARAAETKVALRELQDDLAASQQVTDILRNKLHHQASQLADSFHRVRELEEEKRGSLRELLLAREEEKRHFELLITVERKVAELSERLVSREREAIDALASAAILEADLKAVLKENIANKTNSDAFLAELEILQTLKEENVSKLLALQDIINIRDKEIVSLKADVKSLNESKSELRALLAESKKSLADKEVELRAKDPNDEFVHKIQVLEAENESLRSCLQKYLLLSEEKDRLAQEVSRNLELELSVKMQEIAGLSSTKKSLENNLNRSIPKALHDSLVSENLELKERLKIQSVALFQSKEECSVLKERISESHHSRQGLATEITELNRDLCLSKEDCLKLKERTSAAREQQTILQSALNKQQLASDLLAKSQEARVSTAESAAAVVRTQLEDATRDLVDMKTKIANLKADLKEAKEALSSAENATSQEMNEEAMRLNVVIGDLEGTVAELSKHAGDILRRYKLGQLSDPERELAGYIMAQAQSIHEDEVVTKNNELRRREHAIEALNAKVVELQVIVARLLKEKGGNPGSVNTAAAAPHVDEPPIVASTSCAAPTLTLSSHSVSNLSVCVEHLESTASRFHDIDGDEDSEDDIPLSVLSKLTDEEDNNRAAMSNRTKRLRSPTPPVVEEPNRSKRRNKTSAVPKEKVEESNKPSVASKKAAEPTTKAKGKKRK